MIGKRMKRAGAILAVLSVTVMLSACGNVAPAEEAELSGHGEEIQTEEQTVICEQESVFLSVRLPGGWAYETLTAEELQKEDSTLTCAIRFWPEEFPDAVFTLGYDPQIFGICGTGVTSETFTLDNGMTGCMFTETNGDSCWLAVVFDSQETGKADGSYLLMASPGVTAWEVIEPELIRIRDSVQVGSGMGE